MGGTALQSQTGKPADRILKEELPELHNLVNSRLIGSNYTILNSYTGKPSQGDLDVLIVYDKNINQLIKSLFPELTHIVNNGDVSSFLIPFNNKSIQIDFIVTGNQEAFTTRYNYLGRGDFGNILGRITSFYGLKFTMNGLYYILRKQDVFGKSGYYTIDHQVCREIKVATSFNEVSTILELPPVPETFDSLEECSNWIKDNLNLYCGNCFNSTEYNHADRVRIDKRNAYVHMDGEIISSFELNFKRNQVYSNILKTFPNFNTIISNYRKQIIKEEKDNKDFKERIDGKYLKELTNYQGKDICDFIKSFLSNTNKETIVKLPIETVQSQLKDFYEVYRIR